jgi:hypothetical protein
MQFIPYDEFIKTVRIDKDLEREEIDQTVCEIMRRYGPDRHVDGHDYLTDYILRLLNEKDKEIQTLKDQIEQFNWDSLGEDL